MSKILLAGEKKNRAKGRTISIVVHLLLLLIMFFFFFPAPPAKDPNIPPKIVVDFSFKPSSLSTYAHADTGAKKAKTDNVERKKVVKPKTVTPVKPKNPVVKPKPAELPKPVKPKFTPVTTPNTQPDSPVEMVEDDVEVEDPEMELEDVPEPEPLEVETIEVVEVEVPDEKPAEEASSETGDPSDTDGTSETDPSMTDGDGTGKGKTGDGPGDGKGDDDTSGKGNAGDGTGVYDGSGDGVFGRRVVHRDRSVLAAAKETGIIVSKVCIDQSGSVTYVEILEFESTIRDVKTLKTAAKGFYGYKYEPDPSAPAEQCGKLTLSVNKNFLTN